MTITQMNDHVAALCRRHKVQQIVMDGCYPLAYPTLRRVHVRPIESVNDYCTALHELGHVVLNHAPEQSRTWKELLAWEWARENSPVWSGEMDDFRVWCLDCWGIKDYDPAKAILPAPAI